MRRRIENSQEAQVIECAKQTKALLRGTKCNVHREILQVRRGSCDGPKCEVVALSDGQVRQEVRKFEFGTVSKVGVDELQLPSVGETLQL